MCQSSRYFRRFPFRGQQRHSSCAQSSQLVPFTKTEKRKKKKKKTWNTKYSLKKHTAQKCLFSYLVYGGGKERGWEGERRREVETASPEEGQRGSEQAAEEAASACLRGSGGRGDREWAGFVAKWDRVLRWQVRPADDNSVIKTFLLYVLFYAYE